jgi:hypothetical protein
MRQKGEQWNQSCFLFDGGEPELSKREWLAAQRVAAFAQESEKGEDQTM